MYPKVFQSMVEMIKHRVPNDKQPDAWSDLCEDPPVAVVL